MLDAISVNLLSGMGFLNLAIRTFTARRLPRKQGG
jgi:hypothetical protein